MGGLFAFGQWAVAPVSMGYVSLGLVSIGMLALGGGALGVMAAGWLSQGMIAAGIVAAKGLIAFAPMVASPNWRYADGADAAVTTVFFQNHWFYHFTAMTVTGLFWAGLFAWVMPVVLLSWQLWRTRPSRG